MVCKMYNFTKIKESTITEKTGKKIFIYKAKNCQNSSNYFGIGFDWITDIREEIIFNIPGLAF